jgi:hypothetical protein
LAPYLLDGHQKTFAAARNVRDLIDGIIDVIQDDAKPKGVSKRRGLVPISPAPSGHRRRAWGENRFGRTG